MNGIVSFRLCKLTTEELIRKVDEMTDEMYQTGQTPTRHIPARPDEDYDLLVGELVQRMREVIESTPKPDIVQELAKLPRAVQYRGAEFDLVIFNNGKDDIRIVYNCEYGEWYNPFTGYDCDHLYIYENISTEDDLRAAIADCREFLITNNIWKP